MNYAYPSNRTFVTKNALPTNRPLSPQASAIREYVHHHNFSITVDPDTKEATITVTKRQANNE